MEMFIKQQGFKMKLSILTISIQNKNDEIIPKYRMNICIDWSQNAYSERDLLSSLNNMPISSTNN